MSVAPPVACAPDRRAYLNTDVVVAGRILAVLAFVVGAACSSSNSSDGAESTASTEAFGSTEAGTAAPATTTLVSPDGFTQVTLRVTKSTGEICELCVWLADESDERSRGLMGVSDLGGPAGMAFAYATPTDGQFFMFQTPKPLSIAWFSLSGEFIGSADMEPCVDEPRDDCLRYSPGGEFALAVEVPQGRLAEHGLEPGSTAEVLFDTEEITCPD